MTLDHGVWRRNYKIIERFLIALVIIMEISFLITAVIVRPKLSDIISGLIPNIPENSIILGLALLGTTVVPSIQS